MSKRRTSLITINSLTALSKVCSPASANSISPIKTIPFWRNLSSSPERLELELQVENSFGDYHSQDPCRFNGKGSNLNSIGGIGERPKNDVQRNLAGSRPSLGGFSGDNWRRSSQNFSEATGDDHRSVYQNDPVEDNQKFSKIPESNLRESQDISNCYYGGNENLQTLQWPGRVGNVELGQHSFVIDRRGLLESSGGNQNDPMEKHKRFDCNWPLEQYVSAIPESHLRETQGVSNSFHVGNGSAQNLHGLGQEAHEEAWQRSSVFCTQGFAESQGSLGSGFAQNSLQFPPTREDPFGNATMNQHTSGDGQHQLNLSVPPSQPCINGGQDFSNLKGNQSLKVLEFPKPEENLAGSSESGSHWATIEVLDDCCKEEQLDKAVDILQCLEEQRVPIDLPRCLKLIEVCGEAKALEEARIIHDYVTRLLSPLDVSVYNKILVMYLRCGAMEEAIALFDRMPQRNLTSWDNMIIWLARNGRGECAIDMFTQFKLAGLQPDAQMFVGVFTACGLLNDINEGMLHFESMTKDYSIIPLMENYKSIVDMLGSCGYLNEALDFIEKMPMEPSVEVWETLMNLSRIHGHLELGDRCAELVRQIDPSRLDKESEAGFVPGKASDLAKHKKLSNQRHPEIKGTTHHQYRAGDASHPDSDKHYSLLRSLKVQMKEAGYIPETRFVLHDIDQESKEEAIHAHSERLATAQALLTTSARMPIRIIRNLRVCGDCHNFFKIISTLLGREIIHRDAKRFHHVKDGVCSCRDYW